MGKLEEMIQRCWTVRGERMKKVERCGKEVIFSGEEYSEEQDKARKVNTKIMKN